MLNVIRIIFPLMCGVLGWAIGSQDYYRSPVLGAGIGLGTAFLLVLLEIAFTRRFIKAVSVLMFGILFGFVIAYLLIHALYLVPFFNELAPPTKTLLEFGATFICSFMAVMVLLHTQNDFKFVIPFIELSREGRTTRPMVLDTSVIIDGRMVDLAASGLIHTPLVVPRFVLNELQALADSSDKLKRGRGRRGLDILNAMRQNRKLDIQINDSLLDQLDAVDSKLVRLAKMLDATLVTTDYNLNKVATVQGVDVVNINDVAKAVKPIVIQGEDLPIEIVKVGEVPGQGVGYLPDGTMVVVEGCAGRIGESVDTVVTNIHQTSAGRMIFAKPR